MRYLKSKMAEFREEDAPQPVPGPRDPAQRAARARIIDFVDDNQDKVFFSRQLEVHFEDEFYHWITNRAIGDLVDDGILLTESRDLADGGIIHILWHRRNRYYRRPAIRVVRLVGEYAAPNIGASLGLHGEAMVLEGFAMNQFVLRGRDTREYGGREWTRTDHDLDFIFERDGVAYGVEVKNTLGYMDYDELDTKIKLCRYLRIRPVFVCRMLPKNWIWEVIQRRGFALILKYQLYAWTHQELARRVRRELGLPVDSPRRLAAGTMARFMKWHRANV